MPSFHLLNAQDGFAKSTPADCVTRISWRPEAANSLGQCDRVQPLINMLYSTSTHSVQSAAAALQTLANDTAINIEIEQRGGVQALTTILLVPSCQIRLAAATALARIGSIEALQRHHTLQRLVSLMSGPEAPVQIQAASTLCTRAHKDHVACQIVSLGVLPTLTDMIVAQLDNGTVSAAVELAIELSLDSSALPSINKSELVHALHKLLLSSSIWQASAARALETIGTSEALISHGILHQLVTLLSPSRVQVQMQAALTIGVRALDPRLRSWILKLGGVAILVQLLGCHYPATQLAAARALQALSWNSSSIISSCHETNLRGMLTDLVLLLVQEPTGDRTTFSTEMECSPQQALTRAASIECHLPQRVNADGAGGIKTVPATLDLVLSETDSHSTEVNGGSQHSLILAAYIQQAPPQDGPADAAGDTESGLAHPQATSPDNMQLDAGLQQAPCSAAIMEQDAYPSISADSAGLPGFKESAPAIYCLDGLNALMSLCASEDAHVRMEATAMHAAICSLASKPGMLTRMGPLGSLPALTLLLGSEAAQHASSKALQKLPCP